MPNHWYVLRVQSGREGKVRENLLRRIKEKGLDSKISSVHIPIEVVSEIKGGKKKISEQKTLPGYIMVQMEVDVDTQMLLQEVPGLGDFVGPFRKPTPMSDEEVAKFLGEKTQKEAVAPKLKISFIPGDNIKIKEGPFENFDGKVEEVNPQKGLVKVTVTIFGRATPVELEYWQVEAL